MTHPTTKPRDIPPVHPGEILKEEFLDDYGISQYELAKRIGVPTPRINSIVLGKRGISADTALRLARFFDNSPRFWLNLQNQYDLANATDDLGADLERAVPVSAKQLTPKDRRTHRKDHE